MKQEIRVSVRNLIEFILRNGDIDQRPGKMQDVDVMQAGSRAHRKLQKQGGANYKAEVGLKRKMEIDEELTIQVEGRADGIIIDPMDEKRVMIDEIKGTFSKLDHFKEPDLLHQAQADCYACIYAWQHKLETIRVRVTYIHLETEDVRTFEKERTMEELERWFQDLVSKYAVWAKWQIAWQKKRNETIETLKFPFEYRQSQKRMMNGVYRSIDERKHLFIQAPTGTGKTLGTLFPSIKAMGKGSCERIFYLTAKTVARTVAEEAAKHLMEQGLRMKFITLTAKEKICPFKECRCQPEFCYRAKGHFDRVNEGIFDLIEHEDLIDRDTIMKYAGKYELCPFEYQLDVSLWCDGIICDYNYVFDPVVYLKRYFSEVSSDMIFLVDEAHNLVERAREMYSAGLVKRDFDEAYEQLKTDEPKHAGKIRKCSQYFKDFEETKNETGKRYCVINEIGSFILCLMRMVSDLEEYLKEDMAYEQRESLTTLYFDVKRFINTYDLLDEKYIIYTDGDEGNTRIKMYCVNPSDQLSERIHMSRSCIFFSATLLPIGYYKRLLSSKPETDYDLYVESPFPKENRQILIANDVSSRYTSRTQTEYEKIASYLWQIIDVKKGNYLFFFPSYLFMEAVYDIFCEAPGFDAVSVFCQEAGMDEVQRLTFLNHFQSEPKKTTVGFCVLGGVFSEGIDLTGDRLIGAVIVGTGLPGIGSERELLKEYFDQHGEVGFDYAYRFPGMNKVLQAGGRVIRSETDRGIIVLLDERFNAPAYQRLFPREWFPYICTNRGAIAKKLRKLWTE